MAEYHTINPKGLNAALQQVNALRHPNPPPASSCQRIVESIIDNIFDARNRLAIYGSLAPGKPNHAVVQSIPGDWIDGVVRGALHNTGWGSSEGYPGMTWHPKGDQISVTVLNSKELIKHWQRLDDFEGPGYRRILVPVDTDKCGVLVANIYEVQL